jgi:colanic acid biosynthesis protein WcaH
MKTLPYKQYRDIVKKMPIMTVDGIILYKDKYLLIKRKNNPLKGRFWTPGGRVYKGEKIVDALRRKMKEETGLDIKIISLMGFYEDFYKKNEFNLDYVHTVSFVYSAIANTDKVVLDSQSSEYKWAKRLPKDFKIQH